VLGQTSRRLATNAQSSSATKSVCGFLPVVVLR